MSDTHTDILLEDIQDKLQLLLEVTGGLAKDMAEMKPQVASLTADMKVVKAVQKDQGTELREHSRMLHEHGSELHYIKNYLVEQSMPQRA